MKIDRHPLVQRLIELALEEDLGAGDVTTAAVLGERRPAVARIVARQELVVCGLPVARAVFAALDPEVAFQTQCSEGTRASPGSVLAVLEGAADSLLSGERVALNFLQRLSGVATVARRYVEAAAGSGLLVTDTRKTLPGWRTLDKYAVRVGGARNHRAALDAGILIKDNHIAAAGGVRAAVERARDRAPHPLRVEVEVRDLAELQEALDAGAEIVLLDNMNLEQIAAAVDMAGKRCLLEVSGGVTLERIGALAATGAHLVSVGALTHSAPAADISMDLEIQEGH
jgi:nicotinate-nucleotide pyrophosphorylase (carboxylating)